MISIILQPKGGVGKSTFANNILSSYYYNKTGKKIKLIEIDDENSDNLSLSKTEIMDCSIIKTQDIKKIDEIFFNKDDVIIDIGGNKTATIFLSEYKKVNEFENVLFWIPLGAGEQDNINALETYNNIKAMNSDANIAFVLSRSTSTDLEWEFLNFFGNDFLSTDFAIKKQIPNAEYVVIKSKEIINNARYFGKTVFDLSLNQTDFKQKAKEEEDKSKRSKFIFMNRVKNEAIEYVEDLKANVFPVIEKIIDKA